MKAKLIVFALIVFSINFQVQTQNIILNPSEYIDLWMDN